MDVCPALPVTGTGAWPIALIALGLCVTGVLLWRAGRRGISAAAIAVLVLSLAAAVAAPVVAADDDCPTDTTTTAAPVGSTTTSTTTAVPVDSTTTTTPTPGPTPSPTPTPTPAPVPPNAVDDTAAAEAGVPVTIVVLANDTGDGPGIVGTTDPAHGTIAVEAIGTITYTSTDWYDGVDSFTYTIQDATGLTDTATVTVTVTAPFPITVAPTAFDFGNVPVGGESPTQTLVVTNISSAAQTITVGGGGIASPFNAASTSCGGPSIVLAAGGTCTIGYSFLPTAEGPANGSTAIQVDAAGTTRSYTITTTGTGIPPK